jgi:hypothetical protein
MSATNASSVFADQGYYVSYPAVLGFVPGESAARDRWGRSGLANNANACFSSELH